MNKLLLNITLFFGHGSQWIWSSEMGLIHDFNYASVNKINKILQDMNFPQLKKKKSFYTFLWNFFSALEITS